HIVESGLFGLLSGIVALPLTLLGMMVVRMQPAAYVDAARFSVGLFVSLLVIAVTMGMLVGILPAWRIASMPPALQIKQE
ncbi:MAG: ABC transporter, partial [Xanthomonadales bacterium]|nr:ABC transporter [Xanthomonadales bacterium]